MLFILDLISTLSFAFLGASAAMRLRMNFAAVFLSAMLPATGGGTVREFLLGSDTLFWIMTPSYLLAVFAAILVAVFIRSKKQLPRIVNRLLESLGTCVFILVGVLAASESGCSPALVFLCGVITGIGGGIMRQLLFDRRAVLKNPLKIALAALLSLMGCIFVWLGADVIITIFVLTGFHFYGFKRLTIRRRRAVPRAISRRSKAGICL